MKKSLLIVMSAVLLGGMGTIQAGVVANLVDDPGFEELVLATDPSGNRVLLRL